ncbi:MAG: bifunctional 5,10-methylenetetrahydrofolate dehydrogenase/5,10-methenyltetrahydrofolate cyclohydrolase [Candidatus Wildermuthbacteria bacterium]|nr:bifunctional 5,10-methylenetetrahydrofolate dehydrogenase/5,10-methenyltetrahydrofolate cyclohydrolase [Candidatus Wildermuthbacteria bacterium]
MATILKGESLAKEVLLKLEPQTKGKSLKLAVVLVGDSEVSKKYIAEKRKAAERLGILFSLSVLPKEVSQEELEKKVEELSSDSSGVVVQLPLPQHIKAEGVLDKIPPEKDVDVLSTKSFELFKQGKLGILPPTVKAISLLLEALGVPLQNKRVVIVGKGRLVGLPLSIWFSQKGVTPVVVDKSTPNIMEVTKTADILISATGKAGLIKGDMVKEGAVIIDAGTSVESGDTKGDVDFESVSKKASFITPVPGGVGPLTVACLLDNLVTLWKQS